MEVVKVRHKKFLGIPMPIVAVMLSILLAGGALAGIILTRDIPSRVSIVVPYEMTVWEDEACTIELVELDFGKVYANGDTDPLTFYLLNEGDKDFYIAISQLGLEGNLLTLNWDGVTETCPPDSFIFEYVLEEQIVEEAYDDWVNSEQTLTADMNGTAGESIDWIDSGTTERFSVDFGDTKVSPAVDGTPDVSAFSEGDIVRLDDEWMLITGFSGDDAYVDRGYNGTTIAYHDQGTVIYIQEVTIIPLDTELACSDGSSFSVGDEIKVDSEEMTVTAISGNTLTVIRGTPAAHTAGTAIFVWETIPADTIWVKAQIPLAPDASMPITLFLSADAEAEKGDVSFTTIINAADIPY